MPCDLDGDTESTFRDATTRDVSGDSSVALVNLGSARRLTAACRGLVVVPGASAMKPRALGVGVTGGTGPLGLVRFLVGVVGTVGLESGESAFRFWQIGAGGTLGCCALISDCALEREDCLVTAMVPRLRAGL